jgi:biopolymer transport protein ExbB/TolQ
LIGTVIGFILMLTSITIIENFDLTMMQDLLQKMSGGMKVALYTTLTGLITSILLSFQYKFLENKIFDIISLINKFTELHTPIITDITNEIQKTK